MELEEGLAPIRSWEHLMNYYHHNKYNMYWTRLYVRDWDCYTTFSAHHIDCYNKILVMKAIKRNNATKWSENFLVYSYVDIQTVNRFLLLLTFGFSQSSFGWRILNCI